MVVDHGGWGGVSALAVCLLLAVVEGTFSSPFGAQFRAVRFGHLALVFYGLGAAVASVSQVGAVGLAKPDRWAEAAWRAGLIVGAFTVARLATNGTDLVPAVNLIAGFVVIPGICYLNRRQMWCIGWSLLSVMLMFLAPMSNPPWYLWMVPGAFPSGAALVSALLICCFVVAPQRAP